MSVNATDSESYNVRGPLRALQPQTYFPLPLVARCVDFRDVNTLCCPLADEHDEDARHYQYAELHRKLMRAARRIDRHSILLDEVLRELLPHALTCQPEQYEGVVRGVPEAQFLLKRFRRVPQRLSKLPVSVEVGGTLWEKMSNASWHDCYIIPEGRDALKPDPSVAEKDVMSFLGDVINRPWYFFYVTNIMDTNSVVFLLHIAHSLRNASTNLADSMLRYIDILAELIAQHDSLTGLKTFLQQDTAGSVRLRDGTQGTSDAAYDALKAAGDLDFDDPKMERQACEIVRYFLYTSWVRSVSLLFYLVVGQQLEHGASQQWSRFLAVQGLRQLEDLGNLGLGPANYRAGFAPDYMCNWSLELLRRSRSALCLDFGTLMRRYAEQFPNWPGRCKLDSTEPCEGDKPSSCGRFTQATTKPQTAHSGSCNPTVCHLIKWDEASFRSVKGPRAVLVDKASQGSDMLRYTLASHRTMAISHVWAHGQGGRPEDGVNSCLHERYTHLAERFQCTSYWIDSTCIPSDKSLRREAISYINQIFAESSAVLISDKDLQEVPIEDDEDDITYKAQIIVSVLLVCDWNVRAWTLLEAFRGNKSTQLLCKDDRTISLVDVLKLVWRLGPIDLAILIGSVEHLLPFAEKEDRKSVEEAAQMLSQRHASRPGDEIVIWSLLNMRPGTDDALNFWKGTTTVNTAFLLSSIPRIRDAHGCQVSGFSWAPATPISAPQSRQVCVAQDKKQTYTVRYPAYDGNGSFIGNISGTGVRAVWSFMEFDQKALDEHRYEFGEVICPFEDWGLDDMDPDEIIMENPDSVLLCQEAQSALDAGKLVRLIQAASADGLSSYQAAKNRGDVAGPTAAMITSGDGGHTFKWHGVFAQLDEGYWRWQRAEILIV